MGRIDPHSGTYSHMTINPERYSRAQTPFHTQKGVCKNCGHEIYYQFKQWDHFTRVYKPHGFPYTTTKCYAPGEQEYGPIIELPNKRKTCCGCENPEPKL